MVRCGDKDTEAELDHDNNLSTLMDQCKAVKLRLSERKLQFKLKAVDFHGHILSSKGPKIYLEKTRAVLEMPMPMDVKALQHLIMFVTYLGKFMQKRSEVCESLRRLLDKDTVWHWLPKHEETVHDIKRMVTNTPVLKHYNIAKPVKIQSVVSMTGLGCCLLQRVQARGFCLKSTDTDWTKLRSNRERASA